MIGTILGYLPIVVGIGVGLWYPVAFLRLAERASGAVGASGSEPTGSEPTGSDATPADGTPDEDPGEGPGEGRAGASGVATGHGATATATPATVAGTVTRAPARPVDRCALADAFSVALLALLLAWLWVPWQLVPPLVWGVLVGVVAYAALRAVPAWRAGPWVSGPKPARRLAATAVGAVAVLALVAVVVT